MYYILYISRERGGRNGGTIIERYRQVLGCREQAMSDGRWYSKGWRNRAGEGENWQGEGE